MKARQPAGLLEDLALALRKPNTLSMIIVRHRFLHFSRVSVIGRGDREFDIPNRHRDPFIEPLPMLGMTVPKGNVAATSVPCSRHVPIPNAIGDRINPNRPVVDAVLAFIE